MEEIIWYDILYKQPPKVDKPYIVTYYGKFQTPHMQTAEMVWSYEDKRGIEQYFWKYNGIKISGSMIVTHWTERLKPAISEENFDEFLYKKH